MYGGGIFFMGGDPLPHFCTNLLVRVKLGYPPNFNFLGKPLLRTHYVRTNYFRNTRYFHILQQRSAPWSTPSAPQIN